MGDYNNPNENNNNQPNNSDPNQTPNGQPGYQPPQPEQPQYQSNNQQVNPNPNGYQQNNQNPYQNNSYQNNTYQNNPYQNTPYQNNPNQYNQYQQYQTPVQPQSNGMAVGALICGIIGFILSCCLWYVAIPLSIAGLVLGILVLKNKKGGKTLAIVGIILCAITMIIGIFAAIMVIAVASNPEFSNMYQDMLNEIQSSY
jgi:hypothetical protein